MRFKFDWFMKGMVLAVVLAFVWPAPGAKGGFLYPELLNKLGVALVFFLNGLALSFGALRQGASRWQAHLLVQACTFVLFPLAGLLVVRAGSGWLGDELALGIFFLCALPSTVSSSVALTAAAGGSVPVAVFNATLSSFIGVLLTPAWLAFAVHRHKKGVQVVDRLTILLLIYTSFCDSVQRGVWSRYGIAVLLEVVVASLLLFGLALAVLRVACRAVDLPLADRIAVVFCGSKKTLAAGVPMAALIFGDHPALGLLLLPLMVYHPLQLMLGGVMAQRWAEGQAHAATRAA